MKQVRQSLAHIFGAGVLIACILCITILLVFKMMQSIAAIIP